MSEWQPIETAPNDGSWMLAYDADSYWPDRLEETYFLVQWDRDRWRIAIDGQSAVPTHWMPLPDPPA